MAEKWIASSSLLAMTRRYAAWMGEAASENERDAGARPYGASRFSHLPLTNCSQPSSCDCISVFLSSANSATRFAAAVIALAATL